MEKSREFLPCLLVLLLRAGPALFHVVEDPVPHDEEPGDDHVGEQSCAEECAGDDEFSCPSSPPHARAATVSAQVSTFVRIASSE